jgi:hypothetical protein
VVHGPANGRKHRTYASHGSMLTETVEKCTQQAMAEGTFGWGVQPRADGSASIRRML